MNASSKWCVRCTRQGHLSHECAFPNPANFPIVTEPWLPLERRLCSNCADQPTPYAQEPCRSCLRPPKGTYSNWSPKPCK